jgi:hypothetical protein
VIDRKYWLAVEYVCRRRKGDRLMLQACRVVTT